MSGDLDFRERQWGTADGRTVRLCDMDVGHLANVLNWVHDHDGVYGDSIKNDLIREAQHRKLFAFTERQPYASLVDGRWKVIDPETGEGSIIKPSDEYLEAVKDNACYQRMFKAVQEKRKKVRVDK